jgi:hypothetical protein
MWRHVVDGPAAWPDPAPDRSEVVPYFAVDDHMPTHRKFLRLGVDRLPATGLWATAGAWAAGHLTDGFIPDYVIDQWDPGHEVAKRLVAVGLWETAEQDGDQGFQFHEWEQRNGTKEKIEAKRADDAERKRRWRERQARGGDGTFGPPDDGPGGGTPVTESERSPDGVTPDVTRDVTRDETQDSDGSPDGIRGVSHRSQPNPSQPNPPHPSNNNSSAAPRRTRARRGPIDYSPAFEAFWSACHPKRRTGKGDAARAFDAACRGNPLRTGESRATTLTARMAVWVRYWQASGTDPRFTPLPATWLNGNRYDDPPPDMPGTDLATTTRPAPSGRVATTTQRVADIQALKGQLG